MEEHPAHIRKDGDKYIIQTVREHCESAGRYARDCLNPVGLGRAGELAGLIHDCGKCKEEARTYLWSCCRGEDVQRGSVNHTFAAVRYLLNSYHGQTPSRYEDVACEILACAVGGHHGLFDCVDENGADGFVKRLEKKDIGYEESLGNFFEEVSDKQSVHSLYEKAEGEITTLLKRLEAIAESSEEMSLFVGFLSRLLLSAVIEGDRRDTDEFMNGTVYPKYENMSGIWKMCLGSVEKKLDEMPRKPDINRIRAAISQKHMENSEKKLDDLPRKPDINRIRAAISQKCRDAAREPGGIFKLNLPTGAGKTLSALRYSLAHALCCKKSRIIFVMPLLAIIEQNADVIRKFVGDDSLVLEHHSNVAKDSYGDGEFEDSELLSENWLSPIIITTLAQALNTMFSGKTSAIRRFQSLCGSIIVFDEIQSVPTKMLSQFNAMLTFLSEICGATVILCSATQPELAAAKRPLHVEIKDLVRLNSEECEAFRRTRLVDAGAMRLDEIPDFAMKILEKTDSLLIVCNKKSQAQELYSAMSGEVKSFHLSAGMCIAHRRKTLDAIKACLGSEKVVCISTQVIEAGVDISFGSAIRLTAGMDSVVQSAGRCNRNGDSQERAPVYLVTVADENLKQLRDIKTGRDVTLSLLDEFQRAPECFGGDLASEQAIARYYRDYYTATKSQQDYNIDSPVRDSLYSLLSTNRQLSDKNADTHKRFFMHQAFRMAGTLFEVYDNDTTQVVVPYGDGARIIENLNSQRAKTDFLYLKKQVEAAKSYTISLYSYQRRRLTELGALETVKETGITVLKPGFYNNETGLVIDAEKFELLEV